MKTKIKRYIKQLLIKHTGLIDLPLNQRLDPHVEILSRLAAKGLAPEIVIDVGAARGDWSLSVMQVFPNSKFVLVEPLKQHRATLEKIVAQNPSFENLFCCLGDTEGTAEFYVHEDQSSLYPSEWSGTPEPVRVRRLDAISSAKSDRLFIKLDAQGAEAKIIVGMGALLDSCVGIQVEVMFKKIYEGANLAESTMGILFDAGFRIYDISGIRKRADRELLQADIFFIKENKYFEPEQWDLNGKNL